jgi:hypothetical protein
MCTILSFGDHKQKVEKEKRKRGIQRKTFFKDLNAANKIISECLRTLESTELSDFEYAKLKKEYNENLSYFIQLKRYGIDHGFLEADGNRLA